jgi:hypothetical protein
MRKARISSGKKRKVAEQMHPMNSLPVSPCAARRASSLEFNTIENLLGLAQEGVSCSGELD